MQGLQDTELSVFVPLVLEHFLYGHCLSRLGHHCLEHYSERSIPYDLLCIVCEAGLVSFLGEWIRRELVTITNYYFLKIITLPKSDSKH